MDELRIYRFSFDGEWIGGVFIVISETEERAWKIAREYVVEMVLNPETLILDAVVEIKDSSVVYEYNGIY